MKRVIRAVWLALLVLGAATLAARPASAQIARVPNGTLQMPTNPAATYSLDPAFTGVTFTAPVAFATPPGETNRLFVVERAGRIKVIPNLGSPTTSTFLDISARVITAGEEGLLSLAFHPNYASNGFFYIFYSTSVSGVIHERLSRFKVSSNAQVADATSELIMIDQIDDFSNHEGSDLHFGPDGYLYVSLGDEGGGNDSGLNTQNIAKDFFSAIMRIDVDKKAGNLAPNAHASVKAGTYSIPVDNPFVGATSFNGLAVDPTKVRTEFWAVGLRNPWRFSFDSATNKLWCADVGQDAREEIDIIEKGKNYGWAFREGFIATAKPAPAGAVPVDPIWDYDHTKGKAIIGGVVYHGNGLIELGGAYIFGDYASGTVWALQGAPGSYAAVTLGLDAGLSAFGVDPRNGDVLLANVTDNSVKRLVRASGGGIIPAKLSGTGVFSDLTTLTPNPGIVAYAPAIPFWSDNAIKTRWFSIPDVSQKVTFASDSNWTLPTGSVWIKHFDIEMERGNPASRRRLETRVLVKTASGMYGVTYRWNAAQTDADLVDDVGANETLNITVDGNPTTQNWRYPSRAECSACHSAVGGFALSFNTRQLNTTFPYQTGAANQIQALSDAGYFTAAVTNVASLPTLARPDDLTASIELRARSYLQVNCAQCHQPGGTGLGAWDARVAIPLSSTAIINGVLNDNAGDAANRVLAPQDPAHSMLLRRMQNLPLAPRMPPIGSNVLDQASIDLVTQWVNSVVPSADYIFEAESLTRTSVGAVIAPNTDAAASGGTWIALNADGVGDYIEYSLPNIAAGTYAIKMAYKAHPNRGILNLKIDGVQVGGTLDQYAATAGYKETTFGNVAFATSATHIIRLTVTGKNTAGGAYTLSSDKFSLIKQIVTPPPPPPAPTGVSASAGNTQVVLGWTAAAGATSYTVKWSTTSGGPYTAITGVTGTGYTHTGRSNGTTYFYVVSASNAGGESPNSTEVSATPQLPPPPGAPVGLVATPGNAQVTLTWSATAGATSYTVKSALNSGGPYTAFTQAGITATTFTNAGLSNGTTYYYVVSASNSGGEGADSAEKSATPVAPSAPISNLVVNDTATSNPPAGTDLIANSLQWSIQTNFQVNVVAFGDRTVKVTAVPSAASVLLGKSWIRTAADSKNYTAAPLATFTVGGSFVYLAVDNRHNGTGVKPTWLDSTYVDQGYDITITEGTTARPYSVYRKAVTSGSTVTLPTINSPTAPCYIVIVQ